MMLAFFDDRLTSLRPSGFHDDESIAGWIESWMWVRGAPAQMSWWGNNGGTCLCAGGFRSPHVCITSSQSLNHFMESNLKKRQIFDHYDGAWDAFQCTNMLLLLLQQSGPSSKDGRHKPTKPPSPAGACGKSDINPQTSSEFFCWITVIYRFFWQMTSLNNDCKCLDFVCLTTDKTVSLLGNKFIF